MSTPLASASYTFDPRPNYQLLVSAKRYWDPSSPYLSDDADDAYTLVFAHATGFHKEQYEPTIEDLYALASKLGPKRVKIRDVWALDAPNCGEAADLNEETLRWGYEPVFAWQEYARAIHAFLTGVGTGLADSVDFSKRRLVLVGHSWAANAHVLALTFQPAIQPAMLILLEPMCLRVQDSASVRKLLVGGSENRRDIWASREAAYEQFKSRAPWKNWDPRVLKTFVEHGLRPLPSLEYPDKEGVTLRCTRAQETATYRDAHGSATVYRLIKHIVKRVPTHIIYGAVDDYIPRPVKDAFIESGVGGEQNLASLMRIPGAGHLAAQTHPQALAQTIARILAQRVAKL
ncbi:AB hydrolase-1 domain-containing protein [Mycena chlorophos]|uniref:AB hydrolase-1 domain-containing protein n=1 Tax=Mycena chlorophos TaxID=658473 RepID=A0A8H6WP63_MYCCL|nr:AB hydrolase-1 domain-containing protein [Mycena chlorophos]